MIKKTIETIYFYWLDWKFGTKITSTILSVTLCSMFALLIANYVVDAREQVEQTGTQWVNLGDQILLRASEKADEEVDVMETLAKTPFLIAAVQEANANRANWTPERIASQDKAWVNGDPSIQTLMEEIAKNPISAYLIDFHESNPEEVEVFVTDKKGLNLAMTNPTSDFLQADEDWWKSTFAKGQGAIYFGSVEYDESSRSYAMNIGVPIRDPETKEAIGVLRGTLDVSAMINTLGNMKVGRTGDVVLIDSAGIILYSHRSQRFMTPAPDSILALFLAAQRGWKQTIDMDGSSAIVAYSSLDGEPGKSLGWHVLVTQTLAETNQGLIGRLVISLLVAILIAAIGIILSRLVILDSIVTPLTILTKKANELSTGNVVLDRDSSIHDKLSSRKDEIGEIIRAFDRLTVYFQGAASVSTAIAGNDLTVTVIPNSENDVLGIAFEQMVSGLQSVIGEVAESAEAVSRAASQLVAASEQSEQASNQIATTIQQVALGTTRQSEDVNRTASCIEQMGQTVEGVARGAQEQARAIGKASEVALKIRSAIEQATSNAQSGTAGAVEAAEAAREGVKTVEATIASMQTIRQKSEVSTQKIKEMGKRSEQIDRIVETIEEIASQTNLLALNAAIESARVESKGEKTVENILQRHMLGVVSLVAEILASGCELNSKDLVNLAQLGRVEALFISDADGVIVASSDPNSLGFQFSEDLRQESSVFRQLLNRTDGVVIRPIKERDQDGKPYIYVGVSRRDRPGIVQAGMDGDVVYRLGGYSRGFAVVAVEIRKLAEHAKVATKEISALISGIQTSVTEAMVLMEDETRNMERGAAQAAKAGNSLADILSTAEAVHQQVGEIVAAMQQMSASSNDLIKVMETVNAVVKENTAATEELASGSNNVTQAIENIASISEENSAAVEEVSASTEEISAQVEQVSASAAALMARAEGLRQVVALFKLNLTDENPLGECDHFLAAATPKRSSEYQEVCRKA